jgi:hypothetical protein
MFTYMPVTGSPLRVEAVTVTLFAGPPEGGGELVGGGGLEDDGGGACVVEYMAVNETRLLPIVTGCDLVVTPSAQRLKK